MKSVVRLASVVRLSAEWTRLWPSGQRPWWALGDGAGGEARRRGRPDVSFPPPASPGALPILPLSVSSVTFVLFLSGTGRLDHHTFPLLCDGKAERRGAEGGGGVRTRSSVQWVPEPRLGALFKATRSVFLHTCAP